MFISMKSYGKKGEGEFQNEEGDRDLPQFSHHKN